MTPEDLKYVKVWVEELIALGFIERTYDACWCHPIYVVNAANKDPRMTLDLRELNSQTITKTTYMLALEELNSLVHGSQYFFRLDIQKAFWQLELSKDCADLFTFATPFGKYRYKRLPMGYVNSVTELTDRVTEILGDLVGNGVLCYVDDILGYAKSIPELQLLLEKTLRALCTHNVLVNVKKSVFLTQEVVFCGRMITPKGIMADPKKVEAVLELDEPKNVAELHSVYQSAAFFRSTIPDFARKTLPILDCIRIAGKKVGTTAALKMRKVEVNWTPELRQAFKGLKDMLSDTMVLSYPQEADEIWVFTDASDSGFGVVVTYTKPIDAHKPVLERVHYAAGFNSGVFNPTQRRWSVVERELFAIMVGVERFRFILHRPQGFNLLTDHRNLIDILSNGVAADAKRFMADKIERWRLKLSSYKFNITHIAGEENFMADMLSRLPRSTAKAVTLEEEEEEDSDEIPGYIIRMIRLCESALDPTFKVPSLEEIQQSQKFISEEEKLEFRLQLSQGLWKTQEGQVFISNQNELRYRLLVLGHSGNHRGYHSLLQMISRSYFWPTMLKDTREFVRKCIHCASAYASDTVLREQSTLLRATKPREVVGLDFFSPGENSKKHLLTLKDDFTGFTWFKPVASESALEAATALIEWTSMFGLPKAVHTDRGTAFTGAVFAQLTKKFRLSHKLSFPSLHHTHGTVERVHRDLVRAIRAFLSEFQLPKSRWWDVLPLAQAAINGTPTAKLGNRSPREVFCGGADNYITDMLVNVELEELVTKEDWVKRKEKVIKQLQESWEQHSESLHMALSKKEAEDEDRRPFLVPGNLVMFSIGPDAILKKFDRRWVGPYRVLEVLSRHAYKIRDDVTEEEFTTHPARLRLLSKTGDPEFYESQRISQLDEFVFHEVSDIRKNELTGRFELQVTWKGDKSYTRTWEDLEVVKTQEPLKAKTFAETTEKQDLVREASLGGTVEIAIDGSDKEIATEPEQGTGELGPAGGPAERRNSYATNSSPNEADLTRSRRGRPIKVPRRDLASPVVSKRNPKIVLRRSARGARPRIRKSDVS